MKRRVVYVLGVSGLLVLAVAAVALAATIVGTNKADNLPGTPNNDAIYGLNGADTIAGKDGNDNELSGGRGADTVRGNRGNDYVYGGPGTDAVFGNAGDDYVHGGPGADNPNAKAGAGLFGGGGDDIVDGVDGIIGNDRLDGGTDTATGADVCLVDSGTPPAGFPAQPTNDATGPHPPIPNGEDSHTNCERVYHIDVHDSGPANGNTP